MHSAFSEGIHRSQRRCFIPSRKFDRLITVRLRPYNRFQLFIVLISISVSAATRSGPNEKTRLMQACLQCIPFSILAQFHMILELNDRFVYSVQLKHDDFVWSFFKQRSRNV